MKRFIIPALALTLLAGGAGAASAQPFGHDHGGPGYHGGGRWHDGSDWRRGGYVGRGDWGRSRVVDYHAHHLRRPPYGYQWREVDGRYVLAAVATGVIADIILNAH